MRRNFAILILTLTIFEYLAGTAYCGKRTTKTKIQYGNSNQHNYYKGLTKKQADEADAIASRIANQIMNTKSLNSDLKKVKVAAAIVSEYCKHARYEMDEQKFYRTPYGIFVAGVYTCAGATRALGRVLDFMGFEYTHVNENQYSHQYCVLKMDERIGYADGQVGVAGYGIY